MLISLNIVLYCVVPKQFPYTVKTVLTYKAIDSTRPLRECCVI